MFVCRDGVDSAVKSRYEKGLGECEWYEKKVSHGGVPWSLDMRWPVWVVWEEEDFE